MGYCVKFIKVLTVSFALFATGPVQAVPVTIDFDGLSKGETVGSAFAGLGVTFIDAVVKEKSLAGSSGPNTIQHTDFASLPVQSDPIQAIFSSGVLSVSLTGIDVGLSGFSFRAFDAISGGKLVDSSEVSGNGPGSDNFVNLTVSSSSIRRVEFSLNLDDQSAAILAGDGILFDNFSFDLAPVQAPLSASVSEVPVPAALPMFGTGLAAMGFIGWRRRRKSA